MGACTQSACVGGGVAASTLRAGGRGPQSCGVTMLLAVYGSMLSLMPSMACGRGAGKARSGGEWQAGTGSTAGHPSPPAARQPAAQPAALLAPPALRALPGTTNAHAHYTHTCTVKETK